MNILRKYYNTTHSICHIAVKFIISFLRLRFSHLFPEENIFSLQATNICQIETCIKESKSFTPLES